MDNTYEKVAPGLWRAELTIVEKAKKAVPYDPRNRDEQIERDIEDLNEGALPFHFDLRYTKDGNMEIDIINGEERIPVRDIEFGRNIATGRDTLLIKFPVYESYIRAEVEEKVINGEFVVTTRNNYSIPFKAKYGQAYRFTDNSIAPIQDLTGKWSASFGIETEDPYPAIGEFQQKGNKLTGTFLTETGDYRYLDGTVQGNKFYLSTFDGAHAFLFTGKIKEDGSLVGSFRSGKHYRTTWQAVKDESVTLQTPDSLTLLKNEEERFEISFPDTKGNTVTLEDERFKGKAKIVQVFGTWCPNCRDEASFLVDYFRKKPNPNLAIIGLAFEKHREFDKAAAAVDRYRERMGIDYEMLVAGYYRKSEASEALPMINKVISYPTMIFLTPQNKVVKIHTGFSGPATSQFDSFKADFEKTINQISSLL
ncbi:MAG: TlpA family protein disulfide reductase [Saprospiraceae bacterium]|nr:TlpA family protein disulfide reductase [Saprospiraceae bacterium]